MLSDEERDYLRYLQRSTTAPHRKARRARAILLLAKANRFRTLLPSLAYLVDMCCDGGSGFSRNDAEGCLIWHVQGVSLSFPREVATHVVKIACEMPDLFVMV